MLLAPLNLLVLVLVAGMVALAVRWQRGGRADLERLRGGLAMLKGIGFDLPADHPVRRRLEAAPVAELAFEEIARLMRDDRARPAATSLLALERRSGWIERFAQFAVHLGILGTVLALMLTDSADMNTFRERLPIALGTTFWGLVGALALGAIGGSVDGLLAEARLALRLALLDAVGEDDG